MLLRLCASILFIVHPLLALLAIVLGRGARGAQRPSAAAGAHIEALRTHEAAKLETENLRCRLCAAGNSREVPCRGGGEDEGPQSHGCSASTCGG